MDRIHAIRRLNRDHNFTLVSQDLSEVSLYVKLENRQYRTIKAYTPGPFTFILPATREVPRRLQNPKRKTIGLRIPDYPIVQAILLELAEPIMSSTLIMPGATEPLSDPLEIREFLEHEVDLVIDGGPCGLEPTTVVDLVGAAPEIVRQGMGKFTSLVQ